jgi:hypothetical protein
MKYESNRAGAQVNIALVAMKTIAFVAQVARSKGREGRGGRIGWWSFAGGVVLIAGGVAAQPPEAKAPTSGEAECEAIPANTYASGLTDGAWVAIPGTGTTYFYRSACYLDLVRRTGRAELCPKVKQRRTLLGDGSAYSPAACERVAAQFKAAQAQQQRESQAHAKAIQGVFVLGPLSAEVLPNGNWRLRTTAQGTLAGSYRLELHRSRDNLRLRSQTLTLPQGLGTGHAFEWEVTRAEVVGTTPLPAIFPMAASLYYQMPPDAQGRSYEHLSGIQNLTLSAQ